ncbi:hypothetical protein ACFXQA_13690 [Microbacterium sp. P07]|uniref:hypothetical protein n=1 Tax=Microbacterium sp. P07 TaxID=3366952 RepID=UPI0037472BBB
MTSASAGEGGSLPPLIAVAFAAVLFFALAICGLGVTTLVLDADIISLPEGGQVPGIVGMLVAVAVFAGSLALGLRTQHPSFWTAPIVAIAVYLLYSAGIATGAMMTGIDPAAAVAAAGRWLLSWFGVVVAVAALVCAWGGIALVRTRARPPRWGWEGDRDE